MSWAELTPKLIVATDLYAFAEWESVARYCQDSFGVRVVFQQAALEDHSFLDSASIDICGSDAVFEHCKNLDAVIKESYRLLRPGGALYASYGPLWFSAGGDHFSGRGGLTNAFAHLEFSEQKYQSYFRQHLQDVEDFQSGGRYVELDLFSKATTREYLAAFEHAGFHREWLVLETSGQALEFRNRFPIRMKSLVEKWSGRCHPDDFIVKSNLVRLRKPIH